MVNAHVAAIANGMTGKRMVSFSSYIFSLFFFLLLRFMTLLGTTGMKALVMDFNHLVDDYADYVLSVKKEYPDSPAFLVC